eukprot:3847164-Pyramimonas_sp.AAC.1
MQKHIRREIPLRLRHCCSGARPSSGAAAACTQPRACLCRCGHLRPAGLRQQTPLVLSASRT